LVLVFLGVIFIVVLEQFGVIINGFS